MIHTLSLGGKDRKLLFGNYVFRKLEQERGIGLMDISEKLSKLSFEVIIDMVYYALRCAEIADKAQHEEYSADTVSVWLDCSGTDSLKSVLQWIAESITSMTKGFDEDGSPGESSKKNLLRGTGQK